MTTARKLTGGESKPKTITIGVVGTGDPRIDEASRQRAGNIVKTIADLVAAEVRTPDGKAVDVVWTPVLVDGEPQADIVGRQFREAGVDAVICAPDTWAFPQLTLMSLLAHLPADVPVNITCGNSGPKPGVVYAHAVNGALAQSGRLTHLNVGTWPDTGADPKPTDSTVAALVDWAYAAVTCAGLKGRRVVVFGHDSMGMETALAHVIPTRQTFGLEITRLDMKLLADMLNKGAYDKKEAACLRSWIDQHVGKRLDLSQPGGEEKFNQSLALYLIVRDLMAELNAVGGGFMNQLEWGSDRRGIPLPIADVMESLFNSTFDHNGKKTVLPFATEADTQGLLTMLFTSWLSGGNPPLFMDFRKVWEPWEIQGLAQQLGVPFGSGDLWAQKGIVDGNNSGSASFDWAGQAGRLGREDHVGHFHAGGRAVLLPRRRQQRDLHHARRHRLHRRPPGLQRPVRHVQHVLGRGHHGRSAGEAGRRRVAHVELVVAAHLHRAQVRHDGRVQAVRPGQPLPRHVGLEAQPPAILDGPLPTCFPPRPGRSGRSGSKASTVRSRCSSCSTAARTTPRCCGRGRRRSLGVVVCLSVT